MLRLIDLIIFLKIFLPFQLDSCNLEISRIACDTQASLQLPPIEVNWIHVFLLLKLKNVIIKT